LQNRRASDRLGAVSLDRRSAKPRKDRKAFRSAKGVDPSETHLPEQ